MKYSVVCILCMLVYSCGKHAVAPDISAKPSSLIFHIQIDTPGATFNQYATDQTKSSVLFSYVNYSYLIKYPGMSDTIFLSGEYQNISGDTVLYFAYSYLTDKFKISVTQDGKSLGEKYPVWDRLSQIYYCNLRVTIK